jgi:hypothetical protein
MIDLTQIAYTRIDGVDITTIRDKQEDGDRYETSLYEGGEPFVVGTYDTEIEALRGHIFWVGRIARRISK